MMLLHVRRWARRVKAGAGLSGWGLFAVGLVASWAVVSHLSSAVAADLGFDPYYDEIGQSHRGTKLKGRGHTFDVDPGDVVPRHPKTVERPGYSNGSPDRYAYRDEDESYHYEDDGRDYDRTDRYRGSLKDDPIEGRFQSHRYDDRTYDRHWRKRNYTKDWYARERCLPRRLIRRQLRRAGWRGFRRGWVRGNVRYLEARQRATGEIYELAIDRCTGDVISAACIGRANRGFGPVRFRNDVYREDVVIRW